MLVRESQGHKVGKRSSPKDGGPGCMSCKSPPPLTSLSGHPGIPEGPLVPQKHRQGRGGAGCQK